MTVLENIDDSLTYSILINKAANSLYSHITNNNSAVGATDNFRKDSFTITIGKGINCTKGSQEKTVTLTEIQKSSENFDISVTVIESDIKKFMEAVGISTTNKVTAEGLMSFFFALNYFTEKAILEVPVLSQNTATKCKLQYKAPDSSKYLKIPFGETDNNRVTQTKISDIYTQIKNTSQLSDNARSISISSAAHTSSSCSSSCSSSAFIAYFNLG